MASVIKIKKSGTTVAPNTLASGELAYSWASNKLYIGYGTETTPGEADNIAAIGGKLYTDYLNHTPGTLTASAAIIVDSYSKIDNLLIDNLQLNGNTISTTDTNGNLNITPNGVGKTVISNLYIDDSATSIAEYIYDTVGGAITAGTGITVAIDDNANTSTISITATGVNAATYGSATAIPVLTINEQGQVTAASTASVASNLNIAGDTGTDAVALLTDTLTFVGGASIVSTVSNNTVTIDIDSSSTPTFAGISLTNNLAMGSNRITGLADPTDAQDAATKAYVDAARAGLDVKQSVRAATTANITLSGTQTIDAVELIVGDRVLVKDQTTTSQNGIYVVAAGAWSRSSDADEPNEVSPGLFLFVEQGTLNGDNGYVITSDAPLTVGTDSLIFTQFSGAGQIVAGAALTKTGNTLDVQVAATGGIEIVSDALQLKSTVAGAGLSLTDGVLDIGVSATGGIEISTDQLQLKSTVSGAGLTLTNGVLAVGGTANRITINADSIDIANTYAGQATIVTLGTVTQGTWNANTVGVPYGGTGLTSVTARGLLYGNGTSALGITAGSTINGSILYQDSTGNPYWSNTVDGGTF